MNRAKAFKIPKDSKSIIIYNILFYISIKWNITILYNIQYLIIDKSNINIYLGLVVFMPAIVCGHSKTVLRMNKKVEGSRHLQQNVNWS